MFRKSLSIELIEPVVCLRGSPKDKDMMNMLRGVIKLKLSSAYMIHSIFVQFIGISKTLWPEGTVIQLLFIRHSLHIYLCIATQHWDKQVLVDSIIPICKYSMPLKKGTHTFPFEIILSNTLSESIECGHGNVRYKLLCQVHVKPKLFFIIKKKSILQTQRPVVLIRLPTLENQQQCITQTHVINNTGGQLTLVIEKSFILPGTSLPISFYFNTACEVYSIDQIIVRLIERQKYRAPSQQTTRILHHEIILSPSNQLEQFEENEWRTSYTIPDKHALKLKPSTTYPNIRVRHWVQIYLRILFIDGTLKELQIDAPISVFLTSLDHYLHLPKYEITPTQSSSSSSSFLITYIFDKLSNNQHLVKLITAPPPMYKEQ